MSKNSKAVVSEKTYMFPDFGKQFSDLVTIRHRMDVCVLLDVRHGVLNGDPDRSGEQRINPYNGKGIATDSSGKRIIRDNIATLLDNGYECKSVLSDVVANASSDPLTYLPFEYHLYMAHRAILNANNEEIYKAVGISGFEAAEEPLSEALVTKFIKDDTVNEELIALPEGYTIKKNNKDKWVLHFSGELDTDARQEAEGVFAEYGMKALAAKLHKKSKTKTRTNDEMKRLTTELCRRYIDVRLFGAVASTGNSVGNVKGPWQFSHAESVDRVTQIEEAITRVAITRIEDAERKRQDMGRKYILPYALFRQHMFFSPPLAARSGLTLEDMKLFFTALYNYGRFSGSAMRGHIEPVGIYVFVHEHPLGNAHAHDLFNRVKIAKEEGVVEPDKYEDYSITVDDSNMPQGVKLVKLYERTLPGSPAEEAAKAKVLARV